MNTPVVPRRSGRREKVVWGVLVAALLGVMGTAIYTAVRPRGPELDRLGPAPNFTLISQDAKPFSRDELLGTVWIADFMYTRCQGLCPILAQRMATIQEQLTGTRGWKLVSFSVDPEYDTPEVLRAYAAEHGAETRDWTFLTGEKQTVRNLVTQGFHLAVEEGAGDEKEPTLHSQRIVLVDARGQIRGYYDALDQDAMTKLVTDARGLIARGT